jgi:ribosomal protein S18 acetylase RimI-like enzyme
VPAAPHLRPWDPAADAGWAETVLEAELAGRWQARRGELMDPLAEAAEGLVAELDGRPIGLVTWVVGGSFSRAGEAELRVLVVSVEARRHGVGGALLGAAGRALARAGVDRAWLVTTNDNLDALGFYQRHGWRLAQLHAGAVDEARRRLKRAIGRVGATGIPIRDEIVLAIELDGPTSAPAHLG